MLILRSNLALGAPHQHLNQPEIGYSRRFKRMICTNSSQVGRVASIIDARMPRPRPRQF
jgi:hypothetical protein